jgi:ParB-like chromosome segregation protein Spo0J
MAAHLADVPVEAVVEVDEGDVIAAHARALLGGDDVVQRVDPLLRDILDRELDALDLQGAADEAPFLELLAVDQRRTTPPT